MKPTDFKPFIRLSYLEGFFWALMVASAESFALFFAVEQGLSPLKLGAVTTIPLLLGDLAQWWVPNHVDEKQLGRATLGAIALQVIGLFGLYLSAATQFPFVPFLVSLTFYWIGGLLSAPLWLDWASGRLHHSIFQLYIAKRNGFLTLSTLAAFIGLAWLLRSWPAFPMTAVFLIGFASRILSLAVQTVLTRRYPKGIVSPALSPERPETERRKSPIQVDRALWVVFLTTGLLKLGVSFCGPFFLPYLIHDLRLTVWDYVLLASAPLLSRALFLEGWGRASTGFRPFVGLQVSMVFIALIPSVWTFSTDFAFLVLLNFVSGVFWGGFELSCILIVHKLIRDRRRVTFGLHQAIMNSCSVLGAVLGAEAVREGVSYFALFHVSTALRLLPTLVLIVYLFRWPVTRFSVSVSHEYMTTVLSLRPSLENVGRLFQPRWKPNGRGSSKRELPR